MAIDFNVCEIDPSPLPKTEFFILMISVNDGPMVSIRLDGTIEYGPNYVPDEAAKVFWTAVSYNRPYDPKVLLSSMPYQDPADQFWETERCS
jgi:hypothetical protein